MEWFVAIVVFCSSTGGDLGTVRKTDAANCISRLKNCMPTTVFSSDLIDCFQREADGTLRKLALAEQKKKLVRKLICRMGRIKTVGKVKVCD